MIRNRTVLFIITVIVCSGILSFRRIYSRTIAGSVASGETESPSQNEKEQSVRIPTPTFSIESPQDVTMAFYRAYDLCLKNPPKDAGEDIISYCQKNRKYTSTRFLQNLELSDMVTKGADPIICSQNSPKIIQLGRILNRETDTVVYIVESFSTGDIQIPVTLILENRTWKVDSITCPLPS